MHVDDHVEVAPPSFAQADDLFEILRAGAGRSFLDDGRKGKVGAGVAGQLSVVSLEFGRTRGARRASRQSQDQRQAKTRQDPSCLGKNGETEMNLGFVFMGSAEVGSRAFVAHFVEPCGFWPFSTKSADKVHDKGPARLSWDKL